ncbi:pimeloyl-ACP methyl ester carboxylesterase [Kineosphaera limosa]|uniref:alpha/beta hydrolase n=1 Tax=Kineosphaera limosa TaxID=111564 RepID=UPI0009FC5941|nr:alpha/beta hydrolase [Kineosphaera limosa]NYE02105.1 pimeloyl-ACP methyl ester carboxylesterase [Kineosphaera limosa]
MRFARPAAGAALVAAPAWVLATRFDAVRDGHPAYAVVLAVAGFVGLLLIVGALRARRRGAEAEVVRRGGLRLVGAALGLVLAVLVAVGVVWLRPYSGDATAVAAMSGTAQVAVTQDATSITLTPTAEPAEPAGSVAGLIFQPGARVDARAYVPLLTPLAEAGHPVVIVKQPLGIGFLALGAPERIVDAYAESGSQERRWMVAGHSLGGVAAARAAASGDPRIHGLALWASYPDGATTVPQQPVASIYGTRDGLATPADIEASRPLLPADARFVPIDGGIHAYFGDYGPQSGDGTPTIDRATAQAQIIAAMRDLLATK